MEPIDFDSDDLELTEEFLSKAYTTMQIGGDAAPLGKVCPGTVHSVPGRRPEQAPGPGCVSGRC